MRNRNIITNAGLVALTLVSSALAAPITLSYTGTGQTVTVINSVKPILTGGSFNATVGAPSVNTLFWCVDLENTISPGALSATYPANIILVSDTTANSSLVRKGNEVSWEDGQAYTAQQRYNGAAYLLEKIIATGSGYSDDMLQRAIWHLTDLAVGNQTDHANALWNNAAYINAVQFGLNAPTARTWATVSGVAPGGVLSPTDTRQTFLVEVAPIPEPGTYALMGGGLLLLACLRRRRTN